jgi:hypothetical protein
MNGHTLSQGEIGTIFVSVFPFFYLKRKKAGFQKENISSRAIKDPLITENLP